MLVVQFAAVHGVTVWHNWATEQQFGVTAMIHAKSLAVLPTIADWFCTISANFNKTERSK